MKMREGALVFLLFLVSLGATAVVGPTKAELEALYSAAAHEVNAGRYGAALKQLDALETREPAMAAAKNLRGVALMRLAEYDRAEKALRKARELDPAFWEARFNLAEVAFLRKSWAEARHRFEGLLEEKSEQAQGATGDLIQFKILLTWLMQGKEKEAAQILGQLQESSVSPGFYAGKAAFAFRHQDQTEARVALKAAEKSFSPVLNKLFRESFYEIGWLEKDDDALPVALEATSSAERLAQARADFARAERAYRAKDYAEALRRLDAVDAIAPNQAVAYNLRGEIFLVQGQTAEAETAFHNALAADPQMSEARLNLARIPFLKGDYEASRQELEALLGANPAGAKGRQREQLIRYEIFLTLLREGKEAAAQKAMDDFKMMDDTPALYYAQAAWAFQHGNFKLGNNWLANASNLYSPEMNGSFAAPLADLGWLTKPEATGIAPAQVTSEATPASRSSRTPTPAPVVAENKPNPVATPEPRVTPTPAEEESPAPVVVKKKPEPVSPSPASTPEETPAPVKVAESAKKPSLEEEETPSKAKKKAARRTARNKSEDEQSAPRRKRGEIEVRRAKPVNPVASANNPPPAVEPTPEHQNFGDKVARLLLYPFVHRSEKAASPAPAASVPGPRPSATPTPPAPGRQRN